MNDPTRRYKTIRDCYRALSRYNEDPNHPRVREILDNITHITEKNRKRRLDPTVNQHLVNQVNTRKRWIAKAQRSINYYKDEIQRGRNPQYYKQMIEKQNQKIEQWVDEIETIKGQM